MHSFIAILTTLLDCPYFGFIAHARLDDMAAACLGIDGTHLLGNDDSLPSQRWCGLDDRLLMDLFNGTCIR